MERKKRGGRRRERELKWGVRERDEESMREREIDGGGEWVRERGTVTEIEREREIERGE